MKLLTFGTFCEFIEFSCDFGIFIGLVVTFQCLTWKVMLLLKDMSETIAWVMGGTLGNSVLV